jgi:hypothetical protein
VQHEIGKAELTAFLIDQLTTHGVRLARRMDSSGWIKAYCIGGHDRRAPSLGINKTSGHYHCFGCSIHGTWNDLAALIGAEALTEENAPDPFTVLANQIGSQLAKEEQKDLALSCLPREIKPWRKSWREVSAETMRAASAYKWFDDGSRCYRILLPVWLYDEEPMGWIARRLDKSKYTPYRNSTSLEGLIKYVLYPYHLVRKMRHTRSVVLVEGPYDALRLVDRGIPALALLGVENYARTCHIHLTNLGVKTVIMGLDNDNAGALATPKIVERIRRDFEIKYWRYKSKDPGESKARERRALRRLL